MLDPKYIYFSGQLLASDIHIVVEKLLSVQTKSQFLGLGIGLQSHTIQAIFSQYPNAQDRLLSIITEFINGSESTPTWRIIIEALRKPSVKFNCLADELEEEYYPKFESKQISLVF